MPVQWRAEGIVLIGLSLLLAPVFVDLALDSWSTDQGSQGPILLATGLWLFVREWPGEPPVPGRMTITLALLIPALLAYLFGRTTGISWMAWSGAYVAALALLHDRVSAYGMRRLWFPIAYLALLVPPPGLVTGTVINALNAFLSKAAIDLMWAMGFDAAQDGALLYVEQYTLHMVEACAGLGSLLSLFALSMLYIYLRHRTDWRYAALLGLVVLPIAVLANLGRVVLLMVTTVWFGDAIAQGVFHPLAGLIMFTISLMLLVGIDALLAPLRQRTGAGESLKVTNDHG